MTYSIVARDPASGRFGIAIQTCWPFVGAGCPWVESGVGGVATQSFSNVAHGPNGLDLLRSGVAAADALPPLLDPVYGYQATNAIREWEKPRGIHTAIIAMTANAIQGDREACLGAGMDGYVAKPIGQTVLENAIHQVVHQ